MHFSERAQARAVTLLRGSLRRKEQQQQQQQQQEEEDGGGGSGLSNRLPAGGDNVEATAWRHLTAANAIEFQRHVGEQRHTRGRQRERG